MNTPLRSVITAQESVSLVSNASRRVQFGLAILTETADLVRDVAVAIADSLRGGGKILVFGNGGSAACAQHFAAEFTGKLCQDRLPFPALALTVDTSAMTAIANDYGYTEVFARQVRALGKTGDIAIGISTSGKSPNIKAALDAAESLGISTVALTGSFNGLGGKMAIKVALKETARVQEIHDVILHQLAQISERLLVPELEDDSSADRFPFVLSEEELHHFRVWTGASAQILVTTNGVFDLLHEGHHASLRQARLLGDRLVVLINSDDSVRRLKGDARPIKMLAERVSDLQRVPSVDHVVIMPDDTPSRLLGVLRPQIHAKGADYAKSGVPESDVVVKFGGQVEYLALVDGYSTTNIESRVRTQND